MNWAGPPCILSKITLQNFTSGRTERRACFAGRRCPRPIDAGSTAALIMAKAMIAADTNWVKAGVAAFGESCRGR
jgi:hypothetical protein